MIKAHPQATATATILALIVMIGGLVMLVTDPVAQPFEYHQFADSRTVACLQNGLNVLSNLPFLLAGGLGMAALLGRRRKVGKMLPLYAVFFTGLVLTAAGSAYYHLSPSNASLVWDRLPMTLCFTALVSIVIAERIDTRLAYNLFPWLTIMGVGSVIYWSIRDDLRPYLLIQFVPLIVLPLVIWRRSGPGTQWLWLTLLFYLLAKVAELYDSSLYTVSYNVISGHAIKHLLASLGALMIVLKVHYSDNKPASG